MDEPRTHYQISLTARQAVGLFAVLLLALCGAFFFGLKTGLAGRDASPTETPVPRVSERAPTPVSEAMPLVETGVPLPTSSAPSRTELSRSAVTPVPAEPTTPATIQAFEDGTAENAAAAATGAKPAPAVSPASRAAQPARAKQPAPAPAAGKIWVQAASLSSREEASALSARLSGHGFRTTVLTASGPKGKTYRVRVGPYRTEDEASRAVSKLTKQEKIREPWIVPEGK